MTTLEMRMREELVRRSFSASATRTYLRAVQAFQQWVDKPLEDAGPDDLRRYHVHLIEAGRLANATIVLRISALRFLYIRVLKRRDMKEDLPYPKRQKKLPVVLSPEEVGRLIDSAKNLFHRAMLMTLYGAGLRRSELCCLKVANIAFLEALRERLAKFGLTLHPDKTRLLEFGRYAAERRRKRGQGRPETFDFLGFTHCCGTDLQRKFQVVRLTAKKRVRATLTAIREKLYQRRHEPVPVIGAWLQRV